MFEYAEDLNVDKVTIEYAQRADALKVHTVVAYTLHADSLNSVHSKEVAGYAGRVDITPCTKEMGKYIKEKVIREGGFIHKNGQLSLSLCGDCTHLNTEPFERCWPH